MRNAVAALIASVALSSCVAQASPEAMTVEVNINHSRFEPSSFSFPEGTEVTFVIRNDDPIDHEFIVGDRAVQRHHERGTEPNHPPGIPGEISIPAGATRTTTYTFTEAGRLIIGCHLPGHYDFGMRADVDVTD